MIYLAALITILILAIIILSFFKKNSKKQARKMFVQTDAKFKDAKNNSIEDTLKRIKTIAHNNRKYQVGYDVWKVKYNEKILSEEKNIQNEFKSIDSLFATNAEPELKMLLKNLDERIENFKSKCNKFLAELQDFIMLDTIYREEITFLKRTFREVNEYFENKRNLSINTAPQIEKAITFTEKLFEKFEININNSNFVASKELIEEISKNVSALINKVNLAPQINYYTERDIPTQILVLTNKLEAARQEGARLQYNSFKTMLSTIKNQLAPIKLTSKLPNFLECKHFIEDNLTKLQKIDLKIYKENKSQILFKRNKNEVIDAIKKTHATIKTISPLLNDIKNNVSLNNEEKAAIIAFNNKLRELHNGEKNVKALINNDVDFTYSELLEEVDKLATTTRSTLRAINFIYAIIDKKQSSDLRCAREIRKVKLALSQLYSDISSNVFTKDNSKLPKLLDELSSKLNDINHFMKLVPKNLEKIEGELNILRKLLSNVSTQVYTTIERFKIAEKEIMWMSRYRNHSSDLNSLLQTAEIYFNQKNIDRLEETLEIARSTTTIKKFKKER